MIYWEKWSGSLWFLIKPIHDVWNFSSVAIYTFSAIRLQKFSRTLLFCVLQSATEMLKTQLLYVWTNPFLDHRHRYNNKNNSNINITIISQEISNLVKIGQNGGHFTWRTNYFLLLPATSNCHKLLYLNEVVSRYKANPESIA